MVPLGDGLVAAPPAGPGDDPFGGVDDREQDLTKQTPDIGDAQGHKRPRPTLNAVIDCVWQRCMDPPIVAAESAA